MVLELQLEMSMPMTMRRTAGTAKVMKKRLVAGLPVLVVVRVPVAEQILRQSRSLDLPCRWNPNLTGRWRLYHPVLPRRQRLRQVVQLQRLPLRPAVLLRPATGACRQLLWQAIPPCACGTGACAPYFGASLPV